MAPRRHNPGGKLDVAVSTELVMNLITGRATRCKETWDASASDAGAASFLKSTRAATAIPKNVADAARRAAKDLGEKFGSADDAGAEDVYVDPNDPMKFFTNNNKPEDDYLQYALFVAALWLVYEGLKATVTLNWGIDQSRGTVPVASRRGRVATKNDDNQHAR